MNDLAHILELEQREKSKQTERFESARQYNDGLTALPWRYR
jgi:hypothetical protein